MLRLYWLTELTGCNCDIFVQQKSTRKWKKFHGVFCGRLRRLNKDRNDVQTPSSQVDEACRTNSVDGGHADVLTSDRTDNKKELVQDDKQQTKAVPKGTTGMDSWKYRWMYRQIKKIYNNLLKSLEKRNWIRRWIVNPVRKLFRRKTVPVQSFGVHLDKCPPAPDNTVRSNTWPDLKSVITR